jgi:hypothetical protein
MTPEQIKNRIENIRGGLDRADRAHDAEQIGCMLIAISQLTDLVELLFEKAAPPPTPDPMQSVYNEYQAERRIDEWAAYQREND